MKGDTRSLDYSSYVWRVALKQVVLSDNEYCSLGCTGEPIRKHMGGPLTAVSIGEFVALRCILMDSGLFLGFLGFTV